MVQREKVLSRTKEIIRENMPDMFGSVDEMTEDTMLNNKNGNIDSMSDEHPRHRGQPGITDHL